MELINRGGWWKGTKAQWQALPIAERDELSFANTGCLIAYPSWVPPIDCVHIKCQIRRGEKAPIALTEAILAGERESGWFRFMDEEKYERVKAAIMEYAQEHKIYDPWKIPGGWKLFVHGAIEL